MADYVGRVEAAAMLRAWRSAGASMSDTPNFDFRWTRVCFCGQQGSDSHPVVGLPLFTGSEEGRGPLYDETHVPFEGHTGPDRGAQGDKVQVDDESGNVPQAVPLVALRIADRMVVSIPGEMTIGMGKRVRAAVLDATQGAGIKRAIISGLANEYLQYFTTPEEYEWQAYEGGSTLYGKTSSVLLQFADADLAKDLVDGKPAPTPYQFDPENGVVANGQPFSTGATSATAVAQPGTTVRLTRAQFQWQGGPHGDDRPLGRAFVTIQKRGRHGRWGNVTSDLGLQILWEVDPNGVYTAKWQVPRDAGQGPYRFLITANGYRLHSQPFRVVRSQALTAKLVSNAGGKAVVELANPEPVVNEDLTYWPPVAKRIVMHGNVGNEVSIPARSLHDKFGNTNSNVLVFSY